MQVSEGLSLTLSSLLIGFCAAILGLARHNILQNKDLCCEPNTACENVLAEQEHSFYNSFTGLRSRYIMANIFFALTAFLRYYTLPESLAIFQSPCVLYFFALVTYTTFLLFADITAWSFTITPEHLLPECSSVSSFITDTVGIFAWFVITISAILFYFFMLTLKNQQDFPKFPTQFTLEDDDEDEDVLNTRPEAELLNQNNSRGV
jgi:hypothetical protein